MNRQQRRAMAKSHQPVGTDKIYYLKQSDIDRIKREATAKAIDEAMVLLLGIPVKVMRDKYHWGLRQRLPEFCEALTDEYQNFADGEMTVEEYEDMIEQYCGVRFERTVEADDKH